MSGDQGLKPFRIDPPYFGDPANLIFGSSRADIRVKAAGRSSNQIDGNRLFTVRLKCFERLDMCFYRLLQERIGRPHGVTGFKVGRQVEGVIDSTADQLKQIAANPPPTPPDPEMLKIQAQQQTDQARHQHEQQMAGMEQQREQARMQMEDQHKQREMAGTAQLEQFKIEAQGQLDQANAARQEAFDRWKAELEAATKIQIAQIQAQASVEATEIKAEQAANEELNDDGQAIDKAKATTKKRTKPIDKLAEMHKEQMEMHGKMIEEIHGLAKAQSRPTKSRILRGPDGRATGVESVS